MGRRARREGKDRAQKGEEGRGDEKAETEGGDM